MTDADSGEEATLFPKTAGERLREARESQGMSLAEVAARTRVPLRHLEAIEASNYSGLPSPTYSVGFAKAYARAIGMDEVAVARDVRAQTDRIQRPPEYQPYEMQDPRRQPPPGLAMAGMVAAVLVVIAVGLWYGSAWFQGSGEPATSTPPTVALSVPVAPATITPSPTTAGQVTLVATDIVWLRVYDADGKSLYEAEMKPGDRYDVPADAKAPMINIGRPDKLQVLVNGSAVPALGDGSRAIKDVGISAEALLARGTTDAAAVTESTDNAAARPTGTTSRDQTPSRRAQRPNRRTSGSTASPATEAPVQPLVEPTAAPASQPQTGSVN